MDPVSLNKLLSIVDAIEIHRERDQLPLETFYKIVDSQGRIKNLERRVQDILRVFRKAHWISNPTQCRDILCLTADFNNLILAWHSGEHLWLMNQELKKYSPYACFLDCLRKETKISVPHRQDKDAQRKLGQTLRDNYGLTFVAFDTFRTWAISVGFAYLSPSDKSLYWGGEWDDLRPSVELFKTACLESYCQTDKISGFANLGHVAHLVCVRLKISFQAFEKKLNQFVEDYPGEVKLAPATIRRELSGYSQITSVRNRSETVRERLALELKDNVPKQIKWLEHRYPEDGVRVKGYLVRLIRWEVEL